MTDFVLAMMNFRVLLPAMYLATCDISEEKEKEGKIRSFIIRKERHNLSSNSLSSGNHSMHIAI
jgi:hypothetical protein